MLVIRALAKEASIQLWLDKVSEHFLPVSLCREPGLRAGWLKPSDTHLGPQTSTSVIHSFGRRK